MNKPKTFEEAKELLGHPELPGMLDQMLIFMAFDQNNTTVAFRAIELLLLRPRREPPEPLDDLDDKTLQNLQRDLRDVYVKYGIATNGDVPK